MEIKIQEESGRRLEAEFIGSGHTICNALSEQLQCEKDVESAGYTINHPLVGEPLIVVDTNGKRSPKAVILSSLGKLKKMNDKFRKEFKGIKC
ncbi:MAG: DNA-directed RNA polymerase subunit L [archaeon]